MKSRSDFWLTLHKLANDLDQEGQDEPEQLDSLVALIEGMKPATFAVYIENLECVTAALNKLLDRCKER